MYRVFTRSAICYKREAASLSVRLFVTTVRLSACLSHADTDSLRLSTNDRTVMHFLSTPINQFLGTNFYAVVERQTDGQTEFLQQYRASVIKMVTLLEYGDSDAPRRTRQHARTQTAQTFPVVHRGRVASGGSQPVTTTAARRTAIRGVQSVDTSTQLTVVSSRR